MSALLDTYGAMLLKAIGVHTLYVLVSVAIGFALGLVFGVLLSRVPKWSNVILPVVSVFQTIPGLVFIGVLFLWIGMTPATVIIALGVLCIVPLTPILEAPVLEPAFAQMLPALFGGLGVAFVSKNWKIAVAPVTLMLILFIFVPALNAGTVGIMVPVGVLFTLAVARVLYKKGVL